VNPKCAFWLRLAVTEGCSHAMIDAHKWVNLNLRRCCDGRGWF